MLLDGRGHDAIVFCMIRRSKAYGCVAMLILSRLVAGMGRSWFGDDLVGVIWVARGCGFGVWCRSVECSVRTGGLASVWCGGLTLW